jgi:hypothetical protein
MKTSIKELSQMNREDALMRCVERVSDAAVIDYKVDRALNVMLVGLAASQYQMSYDEMDAHITEFMFKGGH